MSFLLLILIINETTKHENGSHQRLFVALTSILVFFTYESDKGAWYVHKYVCNVQ